MEEAPFDPLEEAIKAVGGTVIALASRLGLPQNVVSNWRQRRSVPEDKAPAIERETGVLAERLAPRGRFTRVPDANWPNPLGRPVIDPASHPPAPAGKPVGEHAKADQRVDYITAAKFARIFQDRRDGPSGTKER